MEETTRCHGWRTSAFAAALLLSSCHPVTPLSVEIRTPDAAYRPSATLRCEGHEATFTPDVGVLADAHMNNYYGAGLFLGSLAADRIVRVAARPTALDLWSDVSLSGFVREMASRLRAAAGVGSERAPLLLFLGDAANVSCTGELDRFIETMQTSAPGLTWLMAPGNHDSYMMGNVNELSDLNYTAAEARVFAYKNASCTPSIFSYDERSWAAACAEPTRESLPMYKGAWMLRYLSVLEREGAKLTRVDGPSHLTPISAALEGSIDPSICARPRAIEGGAGRATDLGRRHFWVTGKVYSQWRGAMKVACSVPDEELNSYRSYIVQSVDLTEKVRAVLLDTDHRLAPLGLDPTKPWAGISGYMEEEQLADIARHVARARESGQRVVFFAHHPLRELPEGARRRLLMFEPLAFVSAHTHFESSVILQRVNGGRFVELNVGSTTDYPMESMLLETKESSLRWRVLGVREPSLVGAACGYEQVPWALPESACEAEFGTKRNYTAYRHRVLSHQYHNLCLLRQELAEISPLWPGDRGPFRAIEEALGVKWSGDDTLPPAKDFLPFAELMASSVEELRREAMQEGTREREFALCQAMAASCRESHTRGLADTTVERADKKHPDRARPADRYTGADM